MKIYSFEKLLVWQKAIKFNVIIYKTTSLFPKEEIFGLTAQMRKCSVSISSNIAEGSGRHSAKDKARFTEIAFGSALELLNQTIISRDLGYLSNENYNAIRNDIEQITSMLDGLYKSQLKNLESKNTTKP